MTESAFGYAAGLHVPSSISDVAAAIRQLPPQLQEEAMKQLACSDSNGPAIPRELTAPQRLDVASAAGVSMKAVRALSDAFCQAPPNLTTAMAMERVLHMGLPSTIGATKLVKQRQQQGTGAATASLNSLLLHIKTDETTYELPAMWGSAAFVRRQ